MNGNEEEQLPRTRPLSGGIWTLFSWLRRSERSSSESISSIGSDRSVSSFDFLGPTEYGLSGPPLIIPATDPTNTYNSRLRERDIRRQHDCDITIHRKYGLIRFKGYETHTLPSTSDIISTPDKKNGYPRQRRAASECCRRRSAYVPGKRRAPQPPLPVGAATLPRYKRKRPAPKPPSVIIETNKENYKHTIISQMNQHKSDTNDLHLFLNGARSSHKKHEYAKVHERDSKDYKSFLKQLFENRKCNSSVDTSHVKFLPSISELDKQALEIIEKNKAFRAGKGDPTNSKTLSENPWICTKCLRKYQASVLVCLHCQSPQANIHIETNKSIVNQKNKNKYYEQEKLKEMLKEMKDSLPKRSKGNKDNKSLVTETSTLRIGDSTNNAEEGATTNVFSNKRKVYESVLSPRATNKVNGSIITTPSTSHQATSYSANIHESAQQVHNGAINKINIRKESIQCSNPKTSSVSVSIKSVEPNLCKLLSSSLNAVNESLIIGNQKQKNEIQSSSQVNHVNVTNHCKVENRSSNIAIGECSKSVEMKSDEVKTFNAPLRISTLLNPVEVFNKNIDAHCFQRKENSLKNNNIEKDLVLTINKGAKPIPSVNHEKKQSNKTTPLHSMDDRANSKTSSKSNSAPSTSSNSFVRVENKPDQINKVQINVTQKNDEAKPTTVVNSNLPLPRPGENGNFVNKNLEILNHHSRRRNLVNQLEQSIAKGDAKTAAEAAAGMAKLRLSCSVLSFSSQIIADNLPVISNNNELSISKALEAKSNVTTTQQYSNVKGITITTSSSIASQISNNKIPSPTSESRKCETGIQAGPSTTSFTKKLDELSPIQVWIEDKKTARGPVLVNIRRDALMEDLMRHAETSLGLPINLQRWIVGKNLCTDDKIPISALAGADFSAPFYLCLVESGSKENGKGVQRNPVNIVAEEKTNENDKSSVKSGNVYKELMNLEREAIVPNSDSFECEVCMEQCAQGEGAVLRECIHIFCRNCLSDAIRHCQEPVVKCPAVNCSGSLQEREIRALLTLEEYERWLARSLVTAECGTRNTFHCRTTDCKGWAFCEPGVQKFPCPVCKHTNCIPCQALHEGETCEEYQEKLKKAVIVAENNQVDEGTQSFLNSLIRRGEALKCPECDAIITKKWGCDWVKCSACKTEICWVTKGRRWGPAGKGDTSGGCRCGVDGKRCHPTCGYCH